MPEFELDLDEGDAERAERIAATQGQGQERSRAKRGSGGGKSGGSGGSSRSKASVQRENTDLVGRLGDALDKLAAQLEAKGDSELAEAFSDGKDAIAKSLVSLTSSVTFLRKPLLLFLNLLEPVLAFWRIGGILGRRFLERRDRVMAEQETARAEAEAAAGIAVATA